MYFRITGKITHTAAGHLNGQPFVFFKPHFSTAVLCLSQQGPGYSSVLQDLSLSSAIPNTDELVQIKLLTTIMAVQMGAINFSVRQTLSGFTDS